MTEQLPTEIPIEVVGLPKDDIEVKRAELKFRRSVQALAQVYPSMIEARAIVKTSSAAKDRKRYEVRVLIKLPKEQFDLTGEAWGLEELFEDIGTKLKRLMTKPRDKPSHRRRESREAIEEERFTE